MGDVIKWEPVGEAVCACCGARYQVTSCATAKRNCDYVRCERCETVIDEWISNVVRSYDLIEAQAEPLAA